MSRNGTTVNNKGYLRISSGPLRYRYVHRIVAEALLGRALARDEEVHHRNGNKKDPSWSNLIVWGTKDHGWVSAKQVWYMRELDVKLKKEWDEFMDSEGKRFDEKIQATKAEGVPYTYEDGQIESRWENRHHATAGL